MCDISFQTYSCNVYLMLSYVCYGFLGEHENVWIHETIELEDEIEDTRRWDRRHNCVFEESWEWELFKY